MSDLFPLNSLVLKAVLIMGEHRGAILGEKLYVLRPGGSRPIIPVEAAGEKFSVELLAIEPDGVLIGYGGKTTWVTFSAPNSLCWLTPSRCSRCRRDPGRDILACTVLTVGESGHGEDVLFRVKQWL